MKVEIELQEETIKALEQYAAFYNVKHKVIGTYDEQSIEDIIKAAIMMYIRWLSITPSPFISSKGLTVLSRIPHIFSSQGKSLSELSLQTGIPKSTLSGILKGNIPNLENFIRIWLSIGQPPISNLLEIRYDS
jgi:predicted transcriptional regulator